MSVPMSEESTQLLKLLADGQWHNYEDTISQVAKTVAPGRALRRYRTRESNRQTKEGPRKGPALSEHQQILSGARNLAYVASNSLRKNYVEVDVQDGRKMIRLRPDIVPRLPSLIPQRWICNDDPPGEEPGDAPAPPADAEPVEQVEPKAKKDKRSTGTTCASCGLTWSNTGQHEEFHELHEQDNGPPMPVAFFNRPEVEAIVTEIVRREVDELRRELDAFQHGMTRFLGARFADLEVAVAQAVASKRGPFGSHHH